MKTESGIQTTSDTYSYLKKNSHRLTSKNLKFGKDVLIHNRGDNWGVVVLREVGMVEEFNNKRDSKYRPTPASSGIALP
ncbi:hypothetical protein ScPMuIL_008655 [Solemya velum]